MVDKKVSVIIPNYNKGAYLVACIESVLNQTYPRIEIIIVDDCSSDNSREIISSYSQRYPNVIPIFLNSNSGVCNARNVGAKKATGKYLTFLDSDDVYINEKKLQNEVSLIKNDYDIAFSQWVSLDESGNITADDIALRNVYSNRYAICKILSVSMPVYQQLRGYLFTKDLFELVGGYTFPYNFFEDFDFQCRLVLKGRLKYTGDYGEGYRNTPNGLSKQKILDATKIIESIQKNYYNELYIDQKIYYQAIKLKKVIKRSYISRIRSLMKKAFDI